MTVLTKAGWPRPVHGGYPIPWVSPKDDLSAMHPARAAACASGAICAVCGEGYDEGEEAYASVMGKDAPALETVLVSAMDNAIMHKRCARLAISVCPKLKALIEDDNLRIVRTWANMCRVKVGDDGTVQAMLDGEDCTHVSLDEVRAK